MNRLMLTGCAWGLGRLRRRERGTITVEKLIMIGLIVVPLVIVLIYFKHDLTEKFHEIVDGLFGEAGDQDNSAENFDMGK